MILPQAIFIGVIFKHKLAERFITWLCTVLSRFLQNHMMNVYVLQVYIQLQGLKQK